MNPLTDNMNETLIKILIASLLSVVPAFFWGYIFYMKQPEKKSVAAKVFLSGSLSVGTILLYKYLWQFFPWINAFLYANSFKDDIIGFSNFMLIPLDIVITFMLVGIIEEVTKFFAVTIIHEKQLSSITDCIEFFIIAALGFAFTENSIYFYNIMMSRGTENLLMPFIFRSLFSTFAHVMFSGICGYYYGLAHFAGPLLEEKSNLVRWSIIGWIGKLFGYKKPLLISQEKLIQGIVIASILHAFFNILLEMNWTFLLVPFLALGFILLSSLFENKLVDKEYVLEDGATA